jgi:hypothetical protein
MDMPAGITNSHQQLCGRLPVSKNRDALGAAVRNLYAQELKLLSQHGIHKVIFFLDWSH